MPPEPPENPPINGASPADDQPTRPLPKTEHENAAADAPTVALEPVGATADDPIAPYVPIADYSNSEPGRGGGAPPPPIAPDRKSPVPWLIGAAVLIMAIAIALALWQPWAGTQPAPTTPAPSVSETPTIPPIETPTEEPPSVPEPTEEPAPEPTQEPEPDPAPTEITPTPVPSDTAPPGEETPAP